MKSLARAFLFFAVAAPAMSAQAQIYMCKDAAGKTHTSDRPIPECSERAVREYGKDGMMRRDVPPPPTAEEKRQRKLEEEKRKAEALAAEEQAKIDRLLLARYANEKDIEAARRRSIELLQDQIKREEGSIAEADKQLAALRLEEQSYKKRSAAVPADLKRRLDEAVQALASRKKSIEEYKAEAAKVNAKHDEALKRFREIKAQGGVTSAGTAN